jgi:hypothetical protein
MTDFSIGQFISVYKEFKTWIQAYNITNSFRFLDLDIESWGLGSVVANWWNESIHPQAEREMTWLFNDMQDNSVRNFSVAGTSFAPHITEFFTPDNTEQEMFKMCLFPYNWSYFAWMAFENGPGSDQAVYGYAHAMQGLLGPKNIIVITSTEPLSDILTKLRIIKDLGFNGTALWALSGPLGDGGFLENYNLTSFTWLMDQINQDGVAARFTYNSLQYVYLNFVLCWVKLNLWQPWTRTGSPFS